jgi:hypothetical protein
MGLNCARELPRQSFLLLCYEPLRSAVNLGRRDSERNASSARKALRLAFFIVSY